MREGPDLARGAAGGGLAGEGEGAVAGLGVLAGEQVDHVGLLVHPRAARVLVEAHGPERDGLAPRVRVLVGERAELGLVGVERLVAVAAGQLRDEVEGVGLDRLPEVLERDEPVGAGAGGALLRPLVAGGGVEPPRDRLLAREHHHALAPLCVSLRRVGVRLRAAHAVADVGGARRKDAVPLDEGLIHGPARHDLAGDVVPDREVGVGREDNLDVGALGGAVREGAEVEHAVLGRAQALVDDPRPQHRMHLGHVRAPEHDRVGELDVVVAAGGLVDAEGLHEGGHRGGHAVPRVGIEIVGAPARLGELHRRVPLLDQVLAGAHDGDAGRPEIMVHALPLVLHHVEGGLPVHRDEVARLVELAVLHAQERAREPVRAVLDLGQRVSLDAEQAAVDRARRIALHRDHAPIGGGDLDAAAHAAEPAHPAVPSPAARLVGAERQAGCARRPHDGGGEASLQELASRQRPGHVCASFPMGHGGCARGRARVSAIASPPGAAAFGSRPSRAVSRRHHGVDPPARTTRASAALLPAAVVSELQVARQGFRARKPAKILAIGGGRAADSVLG